MTRRAEYPDFAQLLSIKMISGGTENYFVDGRRIGVDDDTFLILNAGRRYGSRVDALQPAHSFSIFFRSGLAQDVLDSLLRSTNALLTDPIASAGRGVEFDERLHEHNRSVTPVLRFIQGVVDTGWSDALWMEEQLHFLLERMLKLSPRRCRAQELIPSAKPATRHELYRRLGLGVTYLHTHYQEPISLRDMATAACLSPFHFLRVFKAVYGMTPSAFLRRKRVQAAARLMRESTWSLTDIAAHVGFGSRTTLFRQLRAHVDAHQGSKDIDQ